MQSCRPRPGRLPPYYNLKFDCCRLNGYKSIIINNCSYCGRILSKTISVTRTGEHGFAEFGDIVFYVKKQNRKFGME